MNSPIPQKGNEIKIKREGVLIRARFDSTDTLEKALIIDEDREIKIKITRNLDEVTFALSWGDFSVKMKKGFGINLPMILSKHAFTHIYKSPLEFYKAILNLIKNSIEKEYWDAQEVYEKYYNK